MVVIVEKERKEINMIQRLTCDACKSEVDVNIYYYDYRITTESWHSLDDISYVAEVRGKALCPCCGATIQEHSRHTLTKGEIIELSQKGK